MTRIRFFLVMWLPMLGSLQAQQTYKPVRDYPGNDFYRNIVMLKTLDVVLGNLTVTYERRMGKGAVGMRVPLSLGIDKDGSGSSIDRNRLFETGIGFIFYANKNRPASFYLSPSFEYGVFRYLPGRGDEGSGLSGSLITVSEPQPITGSAFSWFVSVGWTAFGSEKFTFSMALGYGVHYDQTEYYNYYHSDKFDGAVGSWRPEINLGFRF